MNKKIIKGMSMCVAIAVLCSGCSSQKQSPAEQKKDSSEAEVIEGDALVPRWTDANELVPNPYLSTEEANIHNDIYNSDVTAKTMPLGIHPELFEGVAKDSPNAPPAFFYDNNGRAIAPYSQLMEDGTVISGGIAIRDMDSPELNVEGKFQPYLDDNGAKYGIQISYSFVDKDNYLVGPTTHGHVVMIQTSDENGEVLPVFHKALDVDIVSGAVKALGEEIDQNLLSLAYDYQGNLWFVTGGFHKNPAYSKAGFWGYLDREYIERYMAGETNLNPEEYLYYMKLAEGENAENGMAAHPEGCVILTNQACYLLEAKEGTVNVRWKVPYESSGGKAAQEDSQITGAGLAWGGGSSPTLTNDLVLFTDNQDTVELIAVDVKTGETAVTMPVLELGDQVTVSVENSISVYSPDEQKTSVLICNWYGAGNADIFNPDADSSIQSFNNLYDDNWREKGSSYLMPGVERVDIIKKEDGSYQAKSVWCREDLKDTCMIKFSTGTGYYYGYTQNESTSEWGFFALDYDTGETVLWEPVSDEEKYNNIAVGIMQGDNGNSVYCPTNSQILVRLQDRFAYLPEEPEKKLDITKMKRAVLSDEEFRTASGSKGTPATYLQSAMVEDAGDESTVAFCVNGLDKTKGEYVGYYMKSDGTLERIDNLILTDEKGREVEKQEKMNEKSIYELRVTADASGDMNLAEEEGCITVAVILAVK